MDPYVEMLFFPNHTLTLALLGRDGKTIWKHDLGPGVAPGICFCRVFPFDLDGDGVHELVRGLSQGDGQVLDRTDPAVGRIEGSAAMASEFVDHPGEQVPSYTQDGVLRVWADANAKNTPAAAARVTTGGTSCQGPWRSGALRAFPRRGRRT